MKILLKPGVVIEPLAPAGARILEVLKGLSLPFPATITSGRDGQHSGPADPHRHGEAFDVRTRGLQDDQKAALLEGLHVGLGSRFFAFLEAPGTPNEHIHVQRRKGTTYSLADYLSNS